MRAEMTNATILELLRKATEAEEQYELDELEDFAMMEAYRYQGQGQCMWCSETDGHDRDCPRLED